MIPRINQHKSELLKAISNPLRRKILQNVSFGENSFSRLGKTTNTSEKIIEFHTNRLIKSGLLEWNKNNDIFLSEFGKVVLAKISAISFLEKNKDFFLTHDFGDIPADLSNRIGDLYESKTVYGIPANFTTTKQIVNSAKKYVYCIFTQPPVLIADLMKQKMEKGIKVCLLFGKNSVVPIESNFVKILELATKTCHKNLKKRITERVGINLMMNEKHSLLMFQHKGDGIDMHNSLISSENNFHNWCSEFFYQKWNDAESICRIR